MSGPTPNPRKILIVRPRMGSSGGGHAYAHVDALPMAERWMERKGSYGTFDPVSHYECEGAGPRLEGFRFECQIDGRQSTAYAERWGYEARSGIMTTQDFGLYAPSLKAIARGLDKREAADGRVAGLGQLLTRIARVLKVDGVSCMEIGSGSYENSRRMTDVRVPACYGRAAEEIDAMVARLHQACALRTMPQAA